MSDDRDAGDDSTRLSGLGNADETRFTGAGVARPPAVAAQPDGSIPPGSLLGHTYRIDAILARGGMGEVYRARHAELETEHAIKIILPELANNQRIVDLFRREAAVLRTIRHDAVVAYDGVFRDENGRLYLVMEFADGPSLSKLMHERTFTADEIRLLRDRLADGLAVAHEKGVIHRDISPDNVILPGGEVSQAKIIDFGISKLADPETKTIIGTDFAGKYSYVSPEQLGMFGGQIDARSDIYSLGLVLAAAAQGEPLDMGQSPISVIEARRSVPDLSRVPEGVRADLAGMLQPDPAARPQSMRALARGPGAQQQRQGTDAQHRGGRRATDRRPEGARRVGAAPVAAALAVVVLAGGAGYWYLIGSRDTNGDATQTAQGTETAAPPNGDTVASSSSGDASSTPDQMPPVTGPSQSSDIAANVPSQSESSISPEDGADAGIGEASPPAGAVGQSDGTAEPAVDEVDADASTPASGEPEQPADTQTAMVVPDIARLREDAERLFRNLPCADVRIDVSDRGDIAASGYVGSESDRAAAAEQLNKLPDVGRVENAVAVMKPPLCEALDLLRATTAYGAPTAPLIDPGGNAGMYREGDNLKLTVTAMSDGYLYVDYVDAENDATYVPTAAGETDRYVLHLLPNDRWRSEERPVKAGEEVVIGTLPEEVASYVIRPPFGTYLISAIVSPERLFERPRTIEEPAETYFSDLRERLTAVAERVGRENLPASSATIVFAE
jgi:serine/threonine protein kinase